MTIGVGPWPVKDLPKTLLGYVMEAALIGMPEGPRVRVSSPWDAWWASYRAARTLDGQVQILMPVSSCRACAGDASRLAAARPPQHPDSAGPRSCGCLLEWAMRMRAPAEPVVWPPMALTLALIKPDAPTGLIRERLEHTHDVLVHERRTLTAADTLRMYPEAYGADYVAAHARYMSSAPVDVLVLLAHAPATAGQIKAEIRAELGGDQMRNHLHMPDNPGEALADIAHLAGPDILTGLYEGHERDRAARRLDFYRAALGIGETDPDRAIRVG
ncbi:hypothetical protein AB0M44_45755 [Streptosporangium subroseum]|uniref:hypothetical protein n=1 Tax=Streptosporangium subroseum TaxID=106412 RepID=UPI00341324E9